MRAVGWLLAAVLIAISALALLLFLGAARAGTHTDGDQQP